MISTEEKTIRSEFNSYPDHSGPGMSQEYSQKFSLPFQTYFVSVFGVARDRRSGSLLATGSVRARTSTAKRLRHNIPNKSDIKGRNVYYFKVIKKITNPHRYLLTYSCHMFFGNCVVKGIRAPKRLLSFNK